MKKLATLTVVAMVAMAGGLLISNAEAAITGFTDRATWESNFAAVTTEDFESETADIVYRNSSHDFGLFTVSHTGNLTIWNALDVPPLFTKDSGGTILGNGTNQLGVFTGVNGPDTVTFTFPCPITGFGAFWGQVSDGGRNTRMNFDTGDTQDIPTTPTSGGF